MQENMIEGFWGFVSVLFFFLVLFAVLKLTLKDPKVQVAQSEEHEGIKDQSLSMHGVNGTQKDQ